MAVLTQIAEARASALTLIASAEACGSEQDALRLRLSHAAAVLDRLALVALALVEQNGKLEAELARLRRKGNSPAAIQSLGAEED